MTIYFWGKNADEQGEESLGISPRGITDSVENNKNNKENKMNTKQYTEDEIEELPYYTTEEMAEIKKNRIKMDKKQQLEALKQTWLEYQMHNDLLEAHFIRNSNGEIVGNTFFTKKEFSKYVKQLNKAYKAYRAYRSFFEEEEDGQEWILKNRLYKTEKEWESNMKAIWLKK